MDMKKTLADVRVNLLPFECWEKLPGESAASFAAFCAFRDYGPDRNIKRAVEKLETDETKRGKRYRVWRLWSTEFQWFKRAVDYDVYVDKLKQAERRKTIEAREEAYRQVTGKMLRVVEKKLDLMDARELAQGNVKEWMEAAVKTEREVFGLTARDDKQEINKQPELKFDNDFEGL
jgi:hypothetical protein